jgi:hypothetical protein
MRHEAARRIDEEGRKHYDADDRDDDEDDAWDECVTLTLH